MPNRIIKESICTSDSIDQLTPFEETVFVRLMVNCDDFGRFDARPKILSAKLFPLKDIGVDEMRNALSALVNADLVTVYEVDGKPYLHLNSWEKHQQTRATKSKYPAPLDSICNQVIADDSKCARIRIRNTLFDNRNSDSLIGDDEAHAIQAEQNRVLDAAEDAGFLNSNSVRAKLLKLYADNGLERMLNAFESCVKHGAPNLAYLEACLKDAPRKAKPRVPAQDFEQRDYTDVQKQLEDETANRVVEMLCRENGLWNEAENKPVDGWREKLDAMRGAS